MPNELDINRDKVEKDNYNNNALMESMVSSTNAVKLPVADVQPTAVNPTQAIAVQPTQQQQPVQTPAEQDSTSALVNKVLYGNGTYNAVQPSYNVAQVQQQQQQQQPQQVMQQQYMNMQQQQPLPMGVNSQPQQPQQMVLPQQQVMGYQQQQPVYNPYQQQVAPVGINSNNGYRF